MIKKLVITNRAALRNKYGANGVKTIGKALSRLALADALRGIATSVAYVDAPSSKGLPKVRSARSEKQNKAAIDALYTKHKSPDYVLILGATDVVPHQRLKNPLFGKDDTDATVPSDLPYACDAPYADDIAEFLGSTRVVGRLPDVRGSTDVAELVTMIDGAAQFDGTQGKKAFVLSARVWKGATHANVKRAFGRTGHVNLCPPKLPPWKVAALGASLHFINCHGADRDPNYYGEPDNYPEAHLPAPLVGNVAPGAVIAAECCYGAQLYNPNIATPLGIASTYLLQGAIAFCGSTNIAYGGATAAERSSADILCTEFLAAVRAKATTGRALLEARQKLIAASAGAPDPFDLKTLAQFLLLGDPSVRPYGGAVKGVKSVAMRKNKVMLSLSTERAAGAAVLAAHPARRQRLRQTGARLAKTTSAPLRRRTRPPDNIRVRLEELVRAQGLVPGAALEFAVAQPSSTRGASPKRPPRERISRAVAPSGSNGEIIHVMFASPKSAHRKGIRGPKRQVRGANRSVAPRINATRAVVARTRDGRIVSYHRLWAKAPGAAARKTG